MQTVTNVTKEPTTLPQASEELIAESKTSYNLYPDSPTHSSSQGCSNSLGSRKSSVCSISSINSSGSSGSPGHQFQRSLSQVKSMIYNDLLLEVIARKIFVSVFACHSIYLYIYSTNETDKHQFVCFFHSFCVLNLFIT